MKALLFGISGLVGSATAPLLAGRFAKVIAPVRRPYGNGIERIEAPQVNFENLPSDLFQGVEVVVYTLGSTLKNAGSAREFRRIEWSLATSILTAAKRAGVSRFVLLSAAGANAESMIPYNRVKGEIERLAEDQGFERLVIARPSLLVGDRAETRIIEGISIKLTRPLLKPLQRWLPKMAPIQDIQVARALAESTTMPLKKRVTKLENADLLEAGGPPIRNVITV